MLLEKGITNEVINRMKNLEYELLKLKEAKQEQGKEPRRESNTNTIFYPKKSPKQLEFKASYFDNKEILIREPLPLRPQYKKKIKEYFKPTNQ